MRPSFSAVLRSTLAELKTFVYPSDSIPLAELMASAPTPDSETGIHDSDGKHEMKEFKVIPSSCPLPFVPS